MGSEETGFQQQQQESLRCANGCGFFGTAATMNLCSKCYRDFRIQEEQSATAKVAVEKSLNPKKSLTTITTQQSESKIDDSSSSSSSPSSDQVAVKSGTGAKNRCSTCNKRVGLTGFPCRCGFTYCSSHRYPEEHKCTFDFKGVAREAIAKANPVVKADKIERF